MSNKMDEQIEGSLESQKQKYMTDNQKKLIFKYCRWCPPCNRNHPLDGRDIQEVMGIMESKGDWHKFLIHSCMTLNFINEGQVVHVDNIESDIFNLFQNFFELMSQWLEART
jgi:hypothetical protein